MEHRKSKKWWVKHKDAVISTVISVVIGYLLGFYMDGCIRVKPTLENIEKISQCLSDSISQYHKEALVSIDYIRYNPMHGTQCKVGINDKIHDHFVAVSAENCHGLRQGEKIYLINVNESDFSIYTKIAFVQLVNDSPQSSADFFINKKMLNRLNIGPEQFSQGIFTIHYKQENK